MREGGNHSFWGFEAERSTAVPRHREIDFRLARKICADLEISVDRLAMNVSRLVATLLGRDQTRHS